MFLQSGFALTSKTTFFFIGLHRSVIDTTAFGSGGTLTIDLEVNEKGYGAFHLLDVDHKLTYAHKRPEVIMLEKHTIGWYGPCETGQMTHRFRGQIKVAMGWTSNEKGSINFSRKNFCRGELK